MIPKPLGVRVLVTALDEERQNLWLPPGALRTRRGIVVDKGDEVRYVEVADEILFATDANHVHEFKLDDDTYFVMAEGCILVILDRHPTPV